MFGLDTKSVFGRSGGGLVLELCCRVRLKSGEGLGNGRVDGLANIVGIHGWVWRGAGCGCCH